MGNCSLKGVVTAKSTQNSIRIMMDSGNILKLEGPKLVQEVVNDFPGYGIFRQGRITKPLSDQEQLLRGHTYYLLPLGEEKKARGTDEVYDLDAKCLNEVEPVRISSAALDLVTNLANGSGLEVLPPPQKGVWRVKLVINTKQLEEILSEEVNTEALIEQMRMAAASGNVTPRRTKSYWGVSLKPILCNVFKVPVDHHQQNEVEPLDLCISSPIKG